MEERKPRRFYNVAERDEAIESLITEQKPFHAILREPVNESRARAYLAGKFLDYGDKEYNREQLKNVLTEWLNKPRILTIVMVYPDERITRTGSRYPVGKHIRAELRDARTDEVIQKHTYSPYSVQRLRNDAKRRGQMILSRRRWIVERP